MPQELMTLAVLAMFILPQASSEDTKDLDIYLDCLTDKKVDIVFVFDTSNSMDGEINELRAVANKFAANLEASHIDYQLGLVEFRDFPRTCGVKKQLQCGSPGDFAYRVKGNGTLTSEIDTFSSWLKELIAGGGGSVGPEAVLAALKHAGNDLTWRDDAEKAIILLTDAGPHPDGSCCNAEGDTLDGTVLGLADLGVRVYVIGPDEASLKKIAKDTGGQFYEIRSGLSLNPILEEITQSISCSFNVTLEVNCDNENLEVTVQLVGKEVIPYMTGQTEVWMYLDQAGIISRYELSYNQAIGAYQVDVPNVCGEVDLNIYGRVGERSVVQILDVSCEQCDSNVTDDQFVAEFSNLTNGFGLQNKQYTTAVRSVAFSPDSTKVATASQDGYARIWDVASGEELHRLRHKNTVVTSAIFSPDGSKLATASEDAHIWDVASGKKLQNLNQDRTPWWPSSVEAMAFSPDGSLIATGGRDNTSRIWDVASGKVRQKLDHGYWVESVSFSPDGTKLATVSDDFTVRIWDVETGKEIRRLTDDGRGASVSFSPDGKKSAADCSGWSACIWDTTSGDLLQSLAHNNSLYSMSFSPDGSMLATASEDNASRIWDVASGKQLHKLTHNDRVWSVSFSPDGTMLATAGLDHSAHIWDVASGKELYNLTHGSKEVFSVSFSPDGTKVATSSYDNTARIWDAASGKELQRLRHIYVLPAVPAGHM